MIVLDTSVLIDGLTGLKRSAPAIRESLAEGERILLPALVLYELLRGPRLSQELAAQEALFPAKSAIPFGPEEAAVGAGLFSHSSSIAPSSALEAVKSIWESLHVRSFAGRTFGPSIPATSGTSPVFDCMGCAGRTRSHERCTQECGRPARHVVQL